MHHMFNPIIYLTIKILYILGETYTDLKTAIAVASLNKESFISLYIQIQRELLMCARMKVVLVAIITVAIISLNLAAPMQWKTDMKNQLLKSLISQALVQQDSPSTEDKDKEMVASFCKILIQILKYFKISKEELFGDSSEDDYCKNFELPPEPRPEDRSTTLAKAYQTFFNLLKNSNIEKLFGEFIKLTG